MIFKLPQALEYADKSLRLYGTVKKPRMTERWPRHFGRPTYWPQFDPVRATCSHTIDNGGSTTTILVVATIPQNLGLHNFL